MRSVHKRKLLPEVILGNGLVRDQHEVLDQHRGSIALVRSYLDRLALFIDLDLALRDIEIDGPPLVALSPEDPCKLIHKEEHLGKLFVLFRLLRILVLNDLFNTRI